MKKFIGRQICSFYKCSKPHVTVQWFFTICKSSLGSQKGSLYSKWEDSFLCKSKKIFQIMRSCLEVQTSMSIFSEKLKFIPNHYKCKYWLILFLSNIVSLLYAILAARSGTPCSDRAAWVEF